MDEPKPRGLTRRDFLKAAGAALGGVALGVGANALGIGRTEAPQSVPTQAAKTPEISKADTAVVQQVEATTAPEKPKQPRDAKLEDLLGEGFRVVRVTQAKGQEYPPQDVENGPGFFVSSRADGLNLPVLQQEGSIFWYKGSEGEATQGGTVVGELYGATVIDSPDSFGRGANVSCAMSLGTSLEGRQVLSIGVDNASYKSGDNTLEPERVVITVEGTTGKTTHVVDKGIKQDVGWQFLVPLGGFQPQLGEGVDGRNVVIGVGDGYRAVKRASISLEQGEKKLTFNFEKKGKPESDKQG